MHNELLAFFFKRIMDCNDVVVRRFADGEISVSDVHRQLSEKEGQCRFSLDFCITSDLITKEEFDNLGNQITYMIDCCKKHFPDPESCPDEYMEKVMDFSERVQSELLKAFMFCLKVSPTDYAHMISVSISTVEDWLFGKCLMSYEQVHELEIRIKAAYARACDLNSAAYKADFENRLEISEFYDKLEYAYDDLRDRGVKL